MLRDHPIFLAPLPIDRGKMIERPWPSDWDEPHGTNQIAVLPLVSLDHKPSSPGWCTYTRDMAEAPEIEVFCGGINSKTSTAAAVWRQGNLLHYGFDLGPHEMNEWAKAVLVNSITYISRFTEDRPIMHTPSPFAANDFMTRERIERIIRHVRQKSRRCFWPFTALRTINSGRTRLGVFRRRRRAIGRALAD